MANINKYILEKIDDRDKIIAEMLQKIEALEAKLESIDKLIINAFLGEEE